MISEPAPPNGVSAALPADTLAIIKCNEYANFRDRKVPLNFNVLESKIRITPKLPTIFVDKNVSSSKKIVDFFIS